MAIGLIVGAAYWLGRWRNQGASRITTARPPAQLVGFHPSRLDLGQHLWDTTVSFDLPFLNGSSAPVLIDGITSSCDCILFEADSYRGRSVQPGEALGIAGALDTGKHPGSLVRTVTLTSAAGKQYTAQLSLEVFGTWSLSKDWLDFADVRLGAARTEYLEQSLTFASDTDDLVGEPECRAPWVQCFVAPRDKGAKEILVRIPADKLPVGVSTTEIVLRTTSHVRPDCAVRVRVNAIPALLVKPPNVFLVGDEPRRVVVFDHDGAGVDLVGAECSHEEVSIRLIPPNELEIQNRSGHRPTETATVNVRDMQGRSVQIRVSAF